MIFSCAPQKACLQLSHALLIQGVTSADAVPAVLNELRKVDHRRIRIHMASSPEKNPVIERVHEAVAAWVLHVLQQGHRPVALGGRPVLDEEGREWVVEMTVTQRPK